MLDNQCKYNILKVHFPQKNSFVSFMDRNPLLLLYLSYVLIIVISHLLNK